jgi:hypothetical protein
MMAFGIFAIILGAKTNKKTPEKIIKVIKPIKQGNLYIICGIVMIISGNVTFFVS